MCDYENRKRYNLESFKRDLHPIMHVTLFNVVTGILLPSFY